MSRKSLQLEGLVPLITQQNYPGAKEFISNICNYFDNPLTKAEIDLAIEKLFSTTDGTIAFLNKSLSVRKHFQDSNVLIFTLWHNLLLKYLPSLNCSTYIPYITEICIKFITSNIGPSAKERERATMVLKVLVEKKVITDSLASTILGRALSVFNLKKTTELFTYEVFRLLGLLAKLYPQNVSDEQAQRIKAEYFKAMNTVMNNQQDIRFRAASGALEGFNDYLGNFAPSPSDEQDTLDCIYACVKKLSIPSDDIKQKSAFRAALDLFKCHSTLFSKQIFRDFRHWQSCLETWLASSIYEDRQRGVFATYAFHQIVANELKAGSSNDNKDILQLILCEFRKTLESATSRPEETRIAIKGFGTMSQLCKRELPDILNDMISLVVQRCELILLADEDTMREVLKHFPDYIQALSTVVSEIKDPQISDIMVENLQNIMIRLIRDFHFLPQTYCTSVVNSLRGAFQSIYLTDVALLDRLLSKVIFEGVVWTCSHKHVFEANFDLEENSDWKNNITFKSYIKLWQELLFVEPEQATLENFSIPDKILDQIILTLLKILEKLDLRTQKRVYTAEDGTDQEFYICDPNFDLCPVRPNDFHIFINLVDFYRELCPQFRRKYFLEWLDIFCVTMVKLALRNPLVSGFLKLLEMGLDIAECLNVSTNFSPELEITLAHVLRIMIVRCQRVSGELQISILELLLQFPTSFYNKHLLDMIPIFKTAFDLGKSMNWLACMAIECLEKLSDNIQSDDLQKLHAEVLPLLDVYLQGHCGMEKLIIREGRGRHKLSKSTKIKKSYYDDNNIQTKIVSFLGKLSSEAASALVLNSAKEEVLVKWDTKKCIQLDLKLADINPVMYLDTLVPRICQLALTSVDRHTKIAACEVVHALVLYLIGARAYQGQIWTELCKRMLMLGCDGDATVQQMFEPLLMQVMHFMSKYENLDRGVEEIMDALMAGISSKSNFGLRDLSASCLREFVEWSIKQTTPQQLAASPVSIEVILGKLKMYSFDSDGCKRVGAALAFNNLYRRLREEETICDVYFVDLLHTFCINFKLSEELTTLPLNDDMNSDLETISDSLNHIARVLSERNYLYNTRSDKRQVPSALNSGTLLDVLKFLITQAGSRKMFYRRKCMNLAESLAPKVDKYSSLAHYFQSISISEDDILEICEGTHSGGGIQTWPTISFMLRQSHEYPEKIIYTWLEYFLKALENFSWFLRENAILPGSRIFGKCKLLRVISYYLDEICWISLPAILETHFPESPLIKDLQTAENINTLKGIINVNIIIFLTEYLNSKCYFMDGSDFWDGKFNRSLRMMVLQLLYEPDKLSIDFHFLKQHKHTEAYVDRLYVEIGKCCLHKELHMDITTDISFGLTNRLILLGTTLEDVLRSETYIATGPYYLNGILHILKSPNNFLIIEQNKTVLRTTSECIARACFETMKRTCLNKTVVTTCTENVKEFSRNLLSIAFYAHDLSNVFVDFVLDKNELHTPNLDGKIKQGAAFLERYESVINEQVTLDFFKKCFTLFNLQSEEEQNYLLRVLTGVLEHRRKTHHDVSGSFGRIIKFCIRNLSILLQKLTDNAEDFHFIEFLSVLASISSTDTLTIKQQVPAIENWIIAKLRSSEMNLEKKCKIISLLPILVGPEDYENHGVMNALEDLQRLHFPLKSTEFSKNSLEETSLKHAFIIVLNALVASKSYVVLDFLFKTTAADENHLMEDEIHKGIKSFTLCLSNEQQVEVLKRTFDTVLNDNYEPLLRLIIFRRFLLNIFKYSSEEALMAFLQMVIKRVNALLEANYRVGNSGRAVEQALVSRIIGYGLIEYFFGTVRKDLYFTLDCPVAKELLGTPKTPSEFVGTFTKKAFYVRTEEFTTPSKDTAELFRQYQCSAYCALCSLVSNTQTELKFYSKFLFEENSRKNEFIWARLVDCSPDKHYVRPGQELEEHAKVRKRFVAIRQLDVQPVVSLKAITSGKRFQTQNIMESSLSQDVRDIDMISHSVRSHSEALRRQEIRSAEAMSVRLEGNDLNKHEIMPMLCGLIKFMYANNITPVITDISIKRSYPWVQNIANAIENIDYNRNVRVFLAQVVDNCSDVFQQFAHVLFKPLLRMLVDECAGNKLNFFITDIIALLISWAAKELHRPKEAEIALINDLLKFVIKNSWNDKKEIFKFNLELIQTMLSVWKNVIKVPSSLLLDMIACRKGFDSSINESGIIILGMILSNELVPWTEMNKLLYINVILSHVENESTSIYQPAAYALGAFLVVLSKTGDQASADNLMAEIRRRLQVLNSKKDHKSEKRFMDILYNVHKSSPDIIDSLNDVICFKIPTAVGVAKRNYLEMVLSRIESFDEEEVYNTIIGIGIKDLLKNSEYQLLALHILNRSIPMLKKHDINSLFDLVKESLELQSTECRDIAYEVCIYIAQNYASALRDEALRLLLKGVSDPDVEIQKRIYHFWSKDANMSPKIVDRLIYLLQQYATNCNSHFLCLCTQLVLDPAIECADAKKQIFAFEDDREAKLHEYHINTKQRGRTLYTLPPLFSESQQSRQSLFKATQLCSLVRNTNTDYVFEPTQDPTSITQARQNFTLQSQSSMPFQMATQVLNRRSQKVAIENRTPTSSNRLRRRFLKDTEKEKRDQVLTIIQTKQKKADQEEQKAKENSVSLYRRYRYGEYPDLLINNLAFLLPLQALARRDLLVAKHLFVSICAAIYEAEDSNSMNFLQQFDEIFQQVLHKSNMIEPTAIAAFLEVSLLKPSVFNLPPEKVATMAKLTKNETVGALYIENRLNADWDSDSSLKLETQHWLQLSDIYSSLKEYEVVSAIFSDKIRTDPRLAKAIELRTNGRADEAQNLLFEVMARNIHVEHYYAYNCYYECSMELGNWSHLTQAIENEVNTVEELWTDNYNFNFVLPKLVHANIQLLLEGRNEPKSFCETIKDWLNQPEKVEYVTNELCEEFMMLLIFSQNFRRCRVLYETYLRKFLKEWSVVNSYHTKTKLDTLLNSQRIAELDYYGQLFVNGFNENSVQELCNKWNSCHIDPTDSLRQWNTVFGYRKYVAALGNKLLQDEQIVEPQEKMKKMIYNMNLQIFNVADEQRNFALAQKYYDRLNPNESDITQTLTHKVSKIKNLYLQSQRTINIGRSFETAWNTATILLHEEVLYQHPIYHIEVLRLKSKMVREILEKIENSQFDKLPETALRDILGMLQTDDFKPGLVKIATKALKDEAWVADHSPDIPTKVRDDSFLNLARFCYDRLGYIDSTSQLSTQLQKWLINSILKAMKYGCKEARQLFPCILQLPSIENGVLIDYFKTHSADIPVWTYLGWIPQILSRMQLKEPCYLDGIVQKIASKYPDALRYPFAIWHKEALFQLSLTESMATYTDRSVISAICESLRHKLCDRFIRSFKYLAIPEAYLSAQLESFERDIRRHSNITDEQFKNLTRILLDDVYCEEEGFQGVAYRRLLKYKADLQNLKELSYNRDEERIRKTLVDVAQSLRGYLRKTHSLTIETSVQLENICPWLGRYQWCGEEDSIKLPGQYLNFSLEANPNIADHTKIVRFNSKIRVLVSQRYPLRVTIHGSNGHNYDYLVKHGEDLKQDQRIQQILELMSQQLREDRSCQRHNLFIRTYQVVPMDRNCGVLSWVTDTVSLHDFIFNCFSRRCPNSNEIVEQTIKSYLEFIGRPSHATQNTSNLTVYGTAACKYTRDQFIQNQRSLENRIDHDILKKALMDLAISPGSFFALRSNFATTLAAMNIAHWILGVGDRHLQNTLISIKDGTVTGIDFGFTFGSGTRDQKVPELTPFRLTPHLVNVMSPMGTSGLIYKCMVYALKVFRRSSRILLACMEVFIREPSINWLDTAMNRLNEDDEKILREWEPRDRVDIARGKLLGYNPMYLFEVELNVGLISRNLEFLAGYIKILRGHMQFNVRARSEKDKLTAEEQVNCLIDQATDPAVLGISYVGFAPWV